MPAMPSLDLFIKLGLFVQPNFLDDAYCDQLLSTVQTMQGQPALVLPASEHQILALQDDPQHRQTEQLQLPDATTTVITQKLQQLQPTLVNHFNLPLSGTQRLLLYRYTQGSYFRAHCDSSTQSDAPLFLQERQVSIIVFLNSPARDPQPGYYSGGSLIFYGLIDPSQWQSHGFPFPAQSGMLVAFRSNIWHEVQTVTSGERYTLVSWYT